MTQAEAAAELAAAGIPQLPAFIEFQTTFGGYSPDEDVTYGIVGLNDEGDGEPRWSEQDELQLVRCDLENRAQIRLRLDQSGVLYYEFNPVAESFESYIVFKAYCDQTLSPLQWTFIDHERQQRNASDHFLTILIMRHMCAALPTNTIQYTKTINTLRFLFAAIDDFSFGRTCSGARSSHQIYGITRR